MSKKSSIIHGRSNITVGPRLNELTTGAMILSYENVIYMMQRPDENMRGT